MNEEDKKDLLAKLEQMRESLEGMRSQNSAEHSEQTSKMRYITEIALWIKIQWSKFSRP